MCFEIEFIMFKNVYFMVCIYGRCCCEVLFFYLCVDVDCSMIEVVISSVFELEVGRKDKKFWCCKSKVFFRSFVVYFGEEGLLLGLNLFVWGWEVYLIDFLYLRIKLFVYVVWGLVLLVFEWGFVKSLVFYVYEDFRFYVVV